MCVRCALDVERSDNCFGWNVSQLEISRFKISLVVDWWMSENWGNVCEFRVECETNEGEMWNEWWTDDEWTMSERWVNDERMRAKRGKMWVKCG